MTMRVQLITFRGCPHADAARQTLKQAVDRIGLAVAVEEVDTDSPLSPASLRGWSSPTILVDGRDIEGQIAPLGAGCRLYRHEDGELRGAPSPSVLDAALQRAR